MAYKSLIDYYGGGMVKPSKGYALGGLIAKSGRQREYSGELRGLQESAERAAKSRKDVGGSFLGKLAVGTLGTMVGGPAGAAAALAGAQALRERGHKKTDFSGGKYAQDIRGELGKKESQFKKQGLARVGIAGVEGYLGGKSGGMFDKAAGGIKGGISQLRDIRGFLGEGGTMGDVLGGYAQKVGESGVFGDTGITRGLLGAGSKAGIAPTVPESMKKTLSNEARQEAFTKGVEPMFEQNEWLWKTPDSSYSPHTERATSAAGVNITGGEQWAVPDNAYAKSVLTPTDTYTDLAEGPDMAGFNKIEFGPTERQLWGSQTDTEVAQEAARFEPWKQPSAPQGAMAENIYQLPDVNVEGVRPDLSSNVPATGGEMLPGAGEGEPLTQSSINSLYPQLSMQGRQEDQQSSIYGLVSGQYDEPYGFGQSQLQTAGGYTGGDGGDFGRGLMDMLMPSRTMPRIGYQSGGQVGYGTSSDPEGALRQMGMGDVADDPRLEKYMEDLPQFSMGYKQELGDITSGARSGLMDISQRARTQQAGSGFAGGGAGSMGQSRAREGLQRQFGTQRRGLVEGYQADLLGAIADIEGKGGFEFGSGTAGSGYSGSISDTEALSTMAGYGGAEEQANVAGSPQNASSGQTWTNANGVEMMWSDVRNNWLPEDQWNYYAQSQSNWA